jgi:hypothetical protein
VPATEGVHVQADTAAKQHPDSHANSFEFWHADPHRHPRVFHGDSDTEHDAIHNADDPGHVHAVDCRPHVIWGDNGRAVVHRGVAAGPAAYFPK